ncbi:MAG: TetR/AcrR family transcriptional regulator [Acidimicrobiales bacterium]
MAKASATAVEAPKAPRAHALPPEERRSMIVAATLPLLLENGEMVTTRQIADAAGIAEGTIFRAFADKDALIAAVVDAALDPAPLEAALGAIEGGQSLADDVLVAAAILQQRVVNIWRLASSIGPRFQTQARRPAVDSDALVRLFAAHRDRLRVKPIVAARLLRALTMSVTHPMLAGEPMSPPEIVQLFLHGVGAPEAPC